MRMLTVFVSFDCENVQLAIEITLHSKPDIQYMYKPRDVPTLVSGVVVGTNHL